MLPSFVQHLLYMVYRVKQNNPPYKHTKYCMYDHKKMSTLYCYVNENDWPKYSKMWQQIDVLEGQKQTSMDNNIMMGNHAAPHIVSTKDQYMIDAIRHCPYLLYIRVCDPNAPANTMIPSILHEGHISGFDLVKFRYPRIAELYMSKSHQE